MTAISYFQRYSQRENHATNNTLLMLRHVYELGPQRLQRLLAGWLGEDQISIGPTFAQQIRGQGSIPDAGIRQAPLSLWVETKLGDDLGEDQIDAHVAHVSALGTHDEQRYLLGLTRRPLRSDVVTRLATRAAAQSVTFLGVTFSELLRVLREECRPHEVGLQAIIEDYADYLASEDLLPTEERWMPIFPCRQSLEENIRFRLYYEPTVRPLKRSTFIGIYADKAVRHVGRVEAVLICGIADDGVTLNCEPEIGSANPDQLNRVLGVIRASVHDLRRMPHRFYLIDDMAESSILKTSPGGIMGMRYLDLDALSGGRSLATTTAVDLAELLKDRTFA